MQIKILAAIFDWNSNQELNLSLFLSETYCQKLGLTNSRIHAILEVHGEKALLEKNVICNSC